MSKPNLRVRTTLMWTAIPLLAWTVAASAQPAATPERAASFKGTLITLNNSGVTGTFTVEQMGQGQIRVSIHATGLEPTTNPHVAHIHGVQGKTNASCPTMAQDTDGDGYVELAEGLTTYGPIMVPLGDVDPNHDGVVDYTMTFNLNKAATYAMGFDKSSLLPLSLREIVIHGLSVPAVGQGTPGEVDGTAGYKTVLPVACAEIEPDTAMQFRTR